VLQVWEAPLHLANGAWELSRLPAGKGKLPWIAALVESKHLAIQPKIQMKLEYLLLSTTRIGDYCPGPLHFVPVTLKPRNVQARINESHALDALLRDRMMMIIKTQHASLLCNSLSKASKTFKEFSRLENYGTVES